MICKSTHLASAVNIAVLRPRIWQIDQEIKGNIGFSPILKETIMRSQLLRFWDYVFNISLIKEPSKEFEKIVEIKIPSEMDIIEKDVDRTLAEFMDTHNKHKTLRSVLIALANVLTRIGYIQGLNAITAAFMFKLYSLNNFKEDELVPSLTFWVVRGILFKFNLGDYYADGFRGYKVICWIFKLVLELYFPEIFERLGSVNFDLNIISTQWFLTMYSNIFSNDIVSTLSSL